MDKDTVFLVVGGDLRQNFLARRLCDCSDFVYTLGLCEDERYPAFKELSLDELCTIKADVIVLPLIATSDGENVNAPFFDKKIPLKKLLDCCHGGTLLVGGKLSREIARIFERAGIACCDYFLREELIIRNCVATAEGTLLLSMENTATTISDTAVVIIGFGKVAKAVARLFDAVGARVHIAARKQSDLAYAMTLGYEAVRLSDFTASPYGYQLIINTAPALLLDSDCLEKIPADTLIIDLASKPGGVDFDYASALGLKVIWALSLPPNDITYETPAEKICRGSLVYLK